MASAAEAPSAPVTRPPTVNAIIDDKEYKIIREGLAEILEPYDADKEAKKTNTGGEEQSVFYNPIQQFNRDLSVLAIKVFSEEVSAAREVSRARHAGKKPKKRRVQPPAKGEAGSGGFPSTTAPPADPAKATGTATDEETNLKRKRGDTSASSSQVQQGAKKVKTGEDKAEPAESPSAGVPTAVDESTSTDVPPEGGNIGARHTNGNHDQGSGLSKIHIRVLDALSATGLRALRYAKEIPEVTYVTANDLSPEAVETIKRNITHNGVNNTVHSNLGNACNHMYNVATNLDYKLASHFKGKYDVIDLDPYGTAGPFIDSAVQALSDGGMLCVTCTDSAIFASVGYLEKTFALYGGTPWRGYQSHEAGLRLITQAVATSAARYGIAIEPLLSLSIDYYVRIFIRVRRSANEVKLLPGKTMMVYNCDMGCHSWRRQLMVKTTTRQNKRGQDIHHFSAAQGPTTSPNCEHCGFKMHMVGPMWGGPLHNPFFIQRLLDKLPELDGNVYGTIPRLEGMLTLALHETLFPPNVSHVKNKDTNGANGTDKEVEEKREDTKKDTPADDSSSIAANSLTADTRGDNTTQAPSPPTAQNDNLPQPPQSEEKPQHIPMERLDPALPDAHPFFFLPSDLAHVIHCQCPSDAAIKGALKRLGYRVTRSHTRAGSIRTDAPFTVIWDIMRAWVKQRAPTKEGAVKENTAGWGIWQRDGAAGKERTRALQKVEEGLRQLLEAGSSTGQGDAKLHATMRMIEEMTKKEATESDGRVGNAGGDAETAGANSDESDRKERSDPDKTDAPAGETVSSKGERMPIVFDEVLGRDPDKKKLVRYQVNPRENWGPQTRAK